MQTGSARVLVVPRPGGGWDLRETRTGPVLGRSGSKQGLILQARVMLEEGRGGRILLLGPDGTVARTLVVQAAGPRPWWYLRPTVWRWVVPLLVVPQVVRAIATLRASPVGVVIGVLGTALVIVFVVCLVLSLRLDRRRAPHDDA